MISQLNNIKVVRDKLFRHLYVERKLNNEAFECENFPDIKILKGMLISQDRFFVATNVFTRISPVLLCFLLKRNVLWDRLKANISWIFHHSNCCLFGVKIMRNNSEIDRNKSAQYKVMSRHYKWLLLITENLSKKTPNDFSSTHVHICVKDALPLITSAQNWPKTAIASLHSTFNVLSDYTHIFNFKMIVFCTSTSSVLFSCPMTSTVPLKRKLTVTCVSILETGDLRRFEDGRKLVQTGENFFTAGFNSGKPRRCQKWKRFQLDLHKRHDSLLIKMVHNVFWTGSEYKIMHNFIV